MGYYPFFVLCLDIYGTSGPGQAQNPQRGAQKISKDFRQL